MMRTEERYIGGIRFLPDVECPSCGEGLTVDFPSDLAGGDSDGLDMEAEVCCPACGEPFTLEASLVPSYTARALTGEVDE